MQIGVVIQTVGDLPQVMSSPLVMELYRGVANASRTVALSSMEAEYRAACSATCEAVWLRRLLGELGFPQKSKTVIQSDNQSCIAIAKNPVFHARTKHIEIQYHFVREKVLDGTISLEYCSTVDNAADIFTKPLP